MKNNLQNPTFANYLLEMAKKVYGIDPMVSNRQRAAILARTAISVQLLESKETYYKIGAFFKKDHSTIIHIVKQHSDRLKYDKEYKELYHNFLLEIGKPINKHEHTFEEIRFQVKKLTNDLLALNFTIDEVITFWQETINQNKVIES